MPSCISISPDFKWVVQENTFPFKTFHVVEQVRARVPLEIGWLPAVGVTPPVINHCFMYYLNERGHKHNLSVLSKMTFLACFAY